MKLKLGLLVLLLGWQGLLKADSHDAELWQTLQQGGVVILMRHADVRNDGDALLRDETCKQEKRLSETGKKQAQQIYHQFKKRKIEIEAVYASPYCRTMESARLSFGQVQAMDYLTLTKVLSMQQQQSHLSKANKAIGSYKGKGVLVMVTHSENINLITFETVAKAEMLVIKPLGGEDFEVLGTLAPASQ